MYNITIIAGARPNFMKIAPIIHAIEKTKTTGSTLDYRLVHAGQHYDNNMSGTFFQQLQIPEPHVNLACSGGTQAEQTAAILVAFEKELLANPADFVLVVGDVTSTMACALVAQKLHTKVAHVEGGIRSNDWSMPEEINRLVTDSITNYFFTTSATANTNLKQSGVKDNQIFFVGNTMIDTLLKQRPNFKPPKLWDALHLQEKGYIVITLHRPANVDEESLLKDMIHQIIINSEEVPLIFPVHPRTAKILEHLDIVHPRLHTVAPLGYLEFNYLVEHAKMVITDSGGITEEASVMHVPCMTLRDNTERPETITLGTNELVGTDPANIQFYLKKLFLNDWKLGNYIPLWDGKTADRIVEVLLGFTKLK
ncbi:UDP-N-acetylglucosamine 2-epimerase (non-hydrolyzing) [Winogradskyella sp.]|nr:UDP-N-acetylglucosamine 2-epimerase (non-hydrolyzing) [Winogradskyella sp.]